MSVLILRISTVLVMGLVADSFGQTVEPRAGEAVPTQPLNVTATNDEIAQLVRELGESSYDRRTAATRRLIAVGPKVIPQLRAAAQSENAEVALRAQRILSRLDRLWFSGVEVTLSVSKSTLAWDDPVDLTIVLMNRSPFVSRVPFEAESGLSDAERHGGDPVDDAKQVVTMLDLADYIHVTRPDGSTQEIRVDDLAIDPAILEAVQQRLARNPATVLDPQKKMTIRVPAFNRGWARYPTYDRGRYEIAFAYRPEWSDEELLGGDIGAVVSEPVALTVTNAAPDAISREGEGASVIVERDGDELVARLINRDDQVVWINTNFGQGAPFAEGAWVFSRDDAFHEQRLAPGPGRSWREFDAARLLAVSPGGDVELARLALADARRTILEKRAGPLFDRWTIHFQYSNPCDRTWQRRQGSILRGNETAPRVLREPLPARLWSTRLHSNRFQLSLSDQP